MARFGILTKEKTVHCGIQYLIDFQSKLVLCSVKSQVPGCFRWVHGSQGLRPQGLGQKTPGMTRTLIVGRQDIVSWQPGQSHRNDLLLVGHGASCLHRSSTPSLKKSKLALFSQIVVWFRVHSSLFQSELQRSNGLWYVCGANHPGGLRHPQVNHGEAHLSKAYP